jgi:hypothetical protein
MSGTYMNNNVQCFNSAGTTLTHATTYSGSYSDIIVVNGNSLTETTTSGACTVVQTGRIVVSGNELSLSNGVVTSATGGSCTLTETLNGSTITPTTQSFTLTTGQAISNATNVPFFSSGAAFGILSIFTDGSGGNCFIVLTKQ